MKTQSEFNFDHVYLAKIAGFAWLSLSHVLYEKERTGKGISFAIICERKWDVSNLLRRIAEDLGGVIVSVGEVDKNSMNISCVRLYMHSISPTRFEEPLSKKVKFQEYWVYADGYRNDFKKMEAIEGNIGGLIYFGWRLRYENRHNFPRDCVVPFRLIQDIYLRIQSILFTDGGIRALPADVAVMLLRAGRKGEGFCRIWKFRTS